MRRAALGTIAVHCLVAIALVSIGRSGEPSVPRRTIELVDVSVDTPAIPSLATTGTPRLSGGSPARAAARQTERAPTPALRAPTPISRATAAHEIQPARVDELLGPAAMDRDSLAGAGGDGDGNGRGRGHGNGIGDGIGLGANAPIDPPPPPPPPPRLSKARPPRLIFPSRQRDVDEDMVPFVAAVVVDEDGYVVGAHLVHGYGGPGDAQAEQLIFRFRYEPALDDDGRAIRARVEQSFLVE